MSVDGLDDWADTANDLAEDGFDATRGWGPSRSARVCWVHNGMKASFKAGDNEKHVRLADGMALPVQAQLFDKRATRTAVDRFCAKLVARALCAPDHWVASVLQSVIAHERVHKRATLQFWQR